MVVMGFEPIDSLGYLPTSIRRDAIPHVLLFELYLHITMQLSSSADSFY